MKFTDWCGIRQQQLSVIDSVVWHQTVTHATPVLKLFQCFVSVSFQNVRTYEIKMYYLADLIDLYRPSRCLWYCYLLAVFLPVLLSSFASQARPIITGILSLCISAHLTVLLPLNPVLNLTFSLLPITSSHSCASAPGPDSTFDCLRYINFLDGHWHWNKIVLFHLYFGMCDDL